MGFVPSLHVGELELGLWGTSSLEKLEATIFIEAQLSLNRLLPLSFYISSYILNWSLYKCIFSDLYLLGRKLGLSLAEKDASWSLNPTPVRGQQGPGEHTHTQKSLSSVWLCDPMDCSPPGSSVRGIFQAWILERVAVLQNNHRDFSNSVTCILGTHWIQTNHRGFSNSSMWILDTQLCPQMTLGSWEPIKGS